MDGTFAELHIATEVAIAQLFFSIISDLSFPPDPKIKLETFTFGSEALLGDKDWASVIGGGSR